MQFTSWNRIAQDLRYGARLLMNRPGFAAVAVLSLALGIGATTAIFSVVYAVLIDPYPYRAADRIGQIFIRDHKNHNRLLQLTMAEYFELKSGIHTMEDVVADSGADTVLTGNGLPEVVRHMNLASNGFDFFGVPPLLGRVYSAKNMPAGQPPEPVAVLSYKLWHSHFGADPNVLGTKLHLGDKLYTVIGVLPVRFTWEDIDVYTPLDLRPSTQERVSVFFRRKENVTSAQISAEFAPLVKKFARESPRYMYPEEPYTINFTSVNEGILGHFQNTLLALLGAVALLLLIACVNVANLLLARATAREGEIAVRISLGAGRRQIMQQLLTESIMLSLAGGLLGIGLAYAGVKAVVALMPEFSIPHEAVISLNLPVLWFALLITVFTGILFGLAPALQLSGRGPAQSLRASAKGSAVTVRARQLHNLLMASEIVLSLVLLTGAGLAVKGMLAMQGKYLGYNPQNVLTFSVPIPEGRYTEWAARQTFYTNILNSLRRLPEVQAASFSATGVPPWSGGRSKIVIPSKASLSGVEARWNLVSDGYLQSLGASLRQGRLLTPEDIARGRQVAVIGESFRQRFFAPAENPIGQQISLDIFTQTIPSEYKKAPGFNPAFEIIGVTSNIRNSGLNEEPEPALYLPYSLISPPGLTVFARTRGNPLLLTNTARQVVRSVDNDQAVTEVRALDWYLSQATSYPRFATFLFGIFAVIGTTLAATGIFSVVSYAVSHRTREFGIRMALGATPAHVLRLVLGSTSRVLVIGLTIGILVSIWLSRAFAGQLEGLGSADAVLFMIVPIVLAAAALIACFLPARSATRVQPMEALRHE